MPLIKSCNPKDHLYKSWKSDPTDEIKRQKQPGNAKKSTTRNQRDVLHYTKY